MLTRSPPESFNPRYFGLESRPSLVVPTALVCANFVSEERAYKIAHPAPILPRYLFMHRMLSKFTPLVKRYQGEVVLAAAVVLVSVLSFQAGKLFRSGQITNPLLIQSANLEEIFLPKEGRAASSFTPSASPKSNTIILPVVASKNSDKYHFLWCAGAAKISAKNKITFASETEATAAGYTLAANCQK